jgi:hypothetical protein
MVRSNDERLAPKIWPPLANGENQTNELTFIRDEQRMAGSELLAKERERSAALVKYSTHTHTGGITFDNEAPVEVGELEYRIPVVSTCCMTAERRRCLESPPECAPAEKMSQGCGDRAVVLDKATVIPRQAEERADRTHCARWRSVQYRQDLLLVHGHAIGRNHMA